MAGARPAGAVTQRGCLSPFFMSHIAALPSDVRATTPMLEQTLPAFTDACCAATVAIGLAGWDVDFAVPPGSAPSAPDFAAFLPLEPQAAPAKATAASVSTAPAVRILVIACHPRLSVALTDLTLRKVSTRTRY
ncbi:hypothetical protein EBO15_38395 [Actinomadura harenae]|uniref:Uncharacterized protein n=1 Tax=Actinomadura harenae TaxID=2483351 RepID=A0A3M2LHG8_9ACTN|nr:hypothetical protein EBO15_38395 [Actinomadura harenae]